MPELINSDFNVFKGYLQKDNMRIDVEFEAPVTATSGELDTAFLAALAQHVDFNYLAIGARNHWETAPKTSNNPKRNIFSEILNAKRFEIGGPVTWGVIAMDTYRNTRQIALELLLAYPLNTVITRELYDTDDEFGECLILLGTHFEFPDWDGRMLKSYMDFCNQEYLDTETLITVGPIRISIQDAKKAKPLCSSVCNNGRGWELPGGAKLCIS